MAQPLFSKTWTKVFPHIKAMHLAFKYVEDVFDEEALKEKQRLKTIQGGPVASAIERKDLAKKAEARNDMAAARTKWQGALDFAEFGIGYAEEGIPKVKARLLAASFCDKLGCVAEAQDRREMAAEGLHKFYKEYCKQSEEARLKRGVETATILGGVSAISLGAFWGCTLLFLSGPAGWTAATVVGGGMALTTGIKLNKRAQEECLNIMLMRDLGKALDSNKDWTVPEWTKDYMDKYKEYMEASSATQA